MGRVLEFKYLFAHLPNLVVRHPLYELFAQFLGALVHLVDSMEADSHFSAVDQGVEVEEELGQRCDEGVRGADIYGIRVIDIEAAELRLWGGVLQRNARGRS